MLAEAPGWGTFGKLKAMTVTKYASEVPHWETFGKLQTMILPEHVSEVPSWDFLKSQAHGVAKPCLEGAKLGDFLQTQALMFLKCAWGSQGYYTFFDVVPGPAPGTLPKFIIVRRRYISMEFAFFCRPSAIHQNRNFKQSSMNSGFYRMCRGRPTAIHYR